MHRPQPAGPVAPHAGEHDPNAARAIDLGDGAEQGIGRGTDAPQGRGLVERDDRSVGSRTHPHMIIARGHVRRVSHDRGAIGRLDDAQRAHGVEPLGETARELRRHVLHDEDRGAAARRQARHDVGERARTTGRGGDAHGEHGAPAQRVLGRVNHRRRRARQHLDVREVRRERPAHGADEFRRERLERGARMTEDFRGRFGDDFHRAQLERANRGLRARPGVRADDDDRPRRLGHDVADGAQPIEPRHLEIECDDVGPVLVHFADRVETVARRGDDAKLGAEDIDQHPAHQRAVVGDDHARAAGRVR